MRSLDLICVERREKSLIDSDQVVKYTFSSTPYREEYMHEFKKPFSRRKSGPTFLRLLIRPEKSKFTRVTLTLLLKSTRSLEVTRRAQTTVKATSY